jgi:hypothetical protein
MNKNILELVSLLLEGDQIAVYCLDAGHQIASMFHQISEFIVIQE